MNEHWQKIQDEKLDQEIRDGARQLSRKHQIQFVAYLICLHVLDWVEFYFSRFWGAGWIVGSPLGSEHRKIFRPIYDFVEWFFRFIAQF